MSPRDDCLALYIVFLVVVVVYPYIHILGRCLIYIDKNRDRAFFLAAPGSSSSCVLHVVSLVDANKNSQDFFRPVILLFLILLPFFSILLISATFSILHVYI